jgi:peptide/nickel transport system permease protein
MLTLNSRGWRMPRVSRETCHLGPNRPIAHQGRRSLAAAIAATATAVTIAACGGSGSSHPASTAASTATFASAKQGGTLTVGIPIAPATMDAAKDAYDTYSLMRYLSNEPLLLVDPETGAIGPGLATSYSYVGTNNMEFQLTLRHDARFADGTLVNSSAVKAWLEYFLKAGGPQLGQIPIEAIATPNEWTVRMTFTKPTPGVPFLLSGIDNYGFVTGPKGLADPGSLATTTDGAGPYELDPSETVAGDHYTFVPNKHYYDQGTIKWKKIVMKVIASPSTMLEAVQSGQVDVAIGDPSTAASAESDGLTVKYAPQGWTGITFTDREGKKIKPLGSLLVRQALNYAVNRKAITSAMLGKFGVPTDQWDSTDGFDPAYQNYYPYDPAKAKQLLAKAGYPNGFTLPIVDSGSDNLKDPLVRAVAQALITQTGLAFLNLVVAAPAPSWGGMVADGVNQIVLDPWLIWPPGLAIVFTILALGLLSNAARDASSERWSRTARTARRRRRRSDTSKATSGTNQAGNRAIESQNAALLSVEGLTVSVGAPPTNLIEDVSFAIGAGEAVAVVGESGCGKSITAMSILGLLPRSVAIDSGRIACDGLDLATCGEARLRQIRGKHIALISQEPTVSLNPAFHVESQIADIVRRHERCSRPAARRKALELLERVRLPDPQRIARKYPHELSGGMAQRVAIARALAGSPRLLIADEPTTALDVTVQAEILDLLREMQTSQGMAILLVTHDWGVVADLCERAVVMYAGQVIERAGVSPVFAEPLHPYTAALLAADPHNTTEDGILPTIPGTVPAPGSWPAGCHFHPRCKHATADCAQAAIAIVSPRDDRETRCIHHEDLLARA